MNSYLNGNRITNVGFFCINADELAVNLLGKALTRKEGNEVYRYLIAETECYMGIEDTACHAHKGQTAKTTVLWERGGTLYVHLIYGLYYMMNIIAGKEGDPMGVLVRGIKDVKGPGRLTRALNIGKDFNREDLLISNRIWIEDVGITPEYQCTPRIGIDYAKKECRNKLWRFTAYDYLNNINIK